MNQHRQAKVGVQIMLQGASHAPVRRTAAHLKELRMAVLAKDVPARGNNVAQTRPADTW